MDADGGIIALSGHCSILGGENGGASRGFSAPEGTGERSDPCRALAMDVEMLVQKKIVPGGRSSPALSAIVNALEQSGSDGNQPQFRKTNSAKAIRSRTTSVAIADGYAF